MTEIFAMAAKDSFSTKNAEIMGYGGEIMDMGGNIGGVAYRYVYIYIINVKK
jgi:hypothetical protein